VRAVLGLGGNLGDRAANLAAAVKALEHLPGTRVTGLSSLYETAPVGYADQPDFLNRVAVVETSLSPRALLGGCLGVEAALGRVRGRRFGPRVVDIDLLLYEGVVSADPELTLPHPRMMERAFVLVPLAELFPDHVALGVPFPDLGSDGVRKL